MCIYPLVFVQFYRTHRLELEKLNTIVGKLPTVGRDTRVLSRALTALGSLQLGSCVCVRVSKNLWYLRSLPPQKTQTAAKIKIPGYLEYTIIISIEFPEKAHAHMHEMRISEHIYIYGKSQLT